LAIFVWISDHTGLDCLDGSHLCVFILLRVRGEADVLYTVFPAYVLLLSEKQSGKCEGGGKSA